MTILKSFLLKNENAQLGLSQEVKEELEDFLTFLCYLSIHYLNLVTSDQEALSVSLVYVTL